MLALIATLAGIAPFSSARAQAHGSSDSKDKTLQPEEDDFSATPFTEYGEFNTDREEEEDTRFFQYGRFFGVSGGLGFEEVSGSRGSLWQGGFPLLDFKLHYWFDFNFALDMGFTSVTHHYDSPDAGQGAVKVNMIRIGLDVKYYFDTKDLSAPISFSNPYVLIGVGSFAKTETSTNSTSPSKDNGLGLSFGGGLEFALKPKKVYLELEGKVHIVQLDKPGLEGSGQDLAGQFYTASANVLFTW